MRQVVQRLVVMLAFAGAFVVPSLARAALLPTCDVLDQLTRMPVELSDGAAVELSDGAPAPSAFPRSRSGAANSCNLGEAQVAPEDADEVKVAGMCDDRGASVIAPPRVHGQGSARIDAAARACGVGSATAATVAPGSDDVPGPGASPVLADHAVIDAAGLVFPPSSELGPAFPPVAGGPRAGVLHGVDRPPR